MQTPVAGLNGYCSALTSFLCHGDVEVTSISGSEQHMSPPMEATSQSEVDEDKQPTCRGRGHGRYSGRRHT